MTGVLGGGTAGRLLGDEAGMHMVLRTARDAEEIAAAAWRRGVAVATMARYFAGPVTTDGLVLGYGGASGGEVTRACRILVNLANAGLPGDGRE
jgi:DNA-binding transcriptional MocR family regulator